jgi:hypothetical protein
MVNWKILFIIFVALFLFSIAMAQNLGGGDITGKIVTAGGKFVEFVAELPGIFSVPINRNVTLSITLEPDNFQLKEDKLQVDSIQITREDTGYLMILNKYEGRVWVNASGPQLGLKGDVNQIKINDVVISSNKKPIEINPEQVTIILKGTEINALKFSGLNGSVKAQENVDFKIDGEPIELSGFQGDLTFSPDEIKIEGKVRKIYIAGEIRSTITS